MARATVGGFQPGNLFGGNNGVNNGAEGVGIVEGGEADGVNGNNLLDLDDVLGGDNGANDGVAEGGDVVEVVDGNDEGLPDPDDFLGGGSGGAETGEEVEVDEEVPIIEEGGAAEEGQEVGEGESVEEGDTFEFVPGDETAVGEGAGACEPV